MKKSFLFIFTLMITFAWCNIFAQQGDQVSAGRIPADLKGESSIISHDPTPIDATIGYAYSTSNGQLRSLPLPGGTPLTNVGTPYTFVDFLGGGCFGGDGNFYVCTVGDATGTPQIWIMNITTGQPTLVGNTGTSAAEGFNGIAYDDLTGTYYGVSGTNLYTFNNSTGTATLVGPMNNTGGLAVDCAIDCAGNMYMHDLGLDNIYSINKTTGAATLIGPTGIAANYGQGMGYDHDANVLYLMAFNATTFTAQLRTVNVTTGATTLVFDYGLDQQTAFDGQASCGPPCPVGQVTNPNPANGATGVSINLPQISWTNGAGATSIEVFFNGASVYSGAPVTSYTLPGALNYSTTYNWKVNGSNGTCTTYGATWTFTTAGDPNLATLFCDDFTAGLGNWTITNDGGTCVWAIFQASEYTMPPTAVGNVMAADADACGSGTTELTTAYLTNPINAVGVNNVYLEFDNDWQAIDNADFCYIDVSIDNGATWQNVLTFGETDVRNTHEVVQMPMVDNTVFKIRFKSVQPGWDWWWAVDNVCISGSVPVELTSFAATADYGVVNLNWITATETNNQGFEVQRSSGSDFETIAFVNGYGTTTETQAYSYSDKSVGVGVYSYRLKQVDFDGTFEYSNVVEVNVPAPASFTLEQNYPNPFNPSTIINFQLKVDSKVSLKVFNILGQEVATLVNTNLVAGAHNVNFDASQLNSGVYLYRIEATGIDGSNFMDVKKMILTK
jgi:hypothetical protein